MALGEHRHHEVNTRHTPQQGIVELTARFALAPVTWILISALSVITISVRADIRDLFGHRAVLYVALSVLVVPAILLVADSLIAFTALRLRGIILTAVGAWLAAAIGRILIESLLAITWGIPNPILSWNVYLAQLLALPVWAAVIGYSRALNVELAETVVQQERLLDRLRMSTVERWNELAAQKEILSRHVADSIRPQINHIRELLSRVDEAGRSTSLNVELQSVAEHSRELVRRASRETADLARQRHDLESISGSKPRRILVGLWPTRGSTAALATSVRATLLALAVTTIPVALASSFEALWLTVVALFLTVGINIAAWTMFGRFVNSWPSITAWALIIIINFLSPLLAYAACTTVLRLIFGVTFLPRLPVAAGSMILIAGIVITLSQIWARDWYALRSSESNIRSLTRQLQQLEANTEAEYERVCQQTARLLHGPIQGRLAAVAMSLSMWRADQPGIPAETLASCRGLIDACLADLDAMMQGDGSLPPVESSLRELRRRWSGLLEIEWRFDPHVVRHIDADMTLRSRIEDFIGDAATNASRHGLARCLSIYGYLSPQGTIDIRAVDDGTGPNLPIVVGSGLGALGSQDQDWTITRAPGGGCIVLCHFAWQGTQHPVPASGRHTP